MTTAEIVSALAHCNNAQRLEVIEAASRFIREELVAREVRARGEEDRRLREAAQRLVDLYAAGGELTEWAALDCEEIRDDYLPR